MKDATEKNAMEKRCNEKDSTKKDAMHRRGNAEQVNTLQSFKVIPMQYLCKMPFLALTWAGSAVLQEPQTALQ